MTPATDTPVAAALALENHSWQDPSRPYLFPGLFRKGALNVVKTSPNAERSGRVLALLLSATLAVGGTLDMFGKADRYWVRLLLNDDELLEEDARALDQLAKAHDADALLLESNRVGLTYPGLDESFRLDSPGARDVLLWNDSMRPGQVLIIQSLSSWLRNAPTEQTLMDIAHWLKAYTSSIGCTVIVFDDLPDEGPRLARHPKVALALSITQDLGEASPFCEKLILHRDRTGTFDEAPACCQFWHFVEGGELISGISFEERDAYKQRQVAETLRDRRIALLVAEGKCQSDLVELLGLSQSSVSKHLKRLGLKANRPSKG